MSSIQKLTPAQIRQLYHERTTEDFPPDELKPLSMIENALARGMYASYGFFSGDQILAYAYFVRVGKNALVDYFAVEKSLRDRGLGSRFIQALIDRLRGEMDCVLLEVDDPGRAPDADELEVRQRRLRFYLRNGLSDTGVCATVYHVPYRILTLPVGNAPAARDVRHIYRSIYRAILSAEVYKKMVQMEP